MTSNNNNNELREELTKLKDRVTELEEMWNEDSDDDSDDSDDIKKEMEEEENRLKELEEGLEEVRKWSTDIETNKTRSNGNRRRIANLESWRQSLGDGGFVPGEGNVGPGGGKRRKRTRGKLRSKSRAKLRAKSRKKRRRKRGGTRKNAGPEKPIVGYNYIINIYHGGQGEKVLRYGNVTGTYMGLAEEFHDGFDSIEGKKYMFKARVPDEDGDEIETIGEIVRLIGPSHINVDGGRRKKRTKKRRKSKGRKRRRKKRTKRRR